MIDGTKRTCMQFKDVRSFLDSILSEDTHAKRVDSLANAALGVMTGASLAVAMIGKSLAQARGLLTKHAVKQVDRLLSNPRIEAVFASWVPEMVGPRKDIVVAGPTLTPTGTWRSSWSRPGDAADLAQRVEGRVEQRAQRLRGRLPAAAGRGAARQRPGHPPGRLRRHQAVRLSRRPGLRLRHPAERQHHGQRSRRDDDRSGRRGPRRPGAQAARCHRGAVPGRRRRVRACQGHEGSLVSGDEQRRCALTADHRPLFKTLERGAELPRYQGSAFRPGPFLSPHQRPATALLLLNAFAVVLLTLLGAAGESLGMISSPTPSTPIPCSARAACSTT